MKALRIKGADISYAQGRFDFDAAAAAGIKFFIIRAGIGTSTDTWLAENISGAKRVGIPFGFYWYSLALSAADAKNEADACLAAIKGEKPEYPVFFDMESVEQINMMSSAQRTDAAKVFCDTITKGGYPCGIYVNPSWLENYYIKSQIVGVYDIWLAAWTYDPDRPTSYDYGQTMWQWGTDTIGGKDVDGDICYVDYPSITKKFYENSGTSQDILRVGDKVRVRRGAKTYYGGNLAEFVYDGIYTVMQTGTANMPDYTVIGQNGKVTAAVNSDDLIPAFETAPLFTVGEKVKVRYGAPAYDGKSLASFVYDQVYTVMQAGKNGAPDYIVIGQNGAVTAAVKAENLTAVSGVQFFVGDKVRVKNGAMTYNNKPLASFVYNQVYTVMQVGKSDAPDYIVIGQDNNVTAAVNAYSLIKV